MRPRRPPSTPTISTTAAQPRSRRTRSLLLAPAPDPRASPAAMIKHARPFGACGSPPLNLDPARQRRAAHLVVAPRAVPRRCRCRHHGHRPRRQPAASLLLRMRLRRRLQLQLRSRLRLRLRLVLPLRAARRGCPGRRASGVVGRRGGGRRGGAQGNPTAPGPFSIFADLLAGIRRDRGQAAVGREQATCGGGRSPLELSGDGAPRGGPLTARRGNHRRRQPLAVSRAGAVVVGLGRARANLARGELRAVFPLRSVVAEGRPGVAEGGLHCVSWVAPCGTIRRPTLAVACPTPSVRSALCKGRRTLGSLFAPLVHSFAQRGDFLKPIRRLRVYRSSCNVRGHCFIHTSEPRSSLYQANQHQPWVQAARCPPSFLLYLSRLAGEVTEAVSRRPPSRRASGVCRGSKKSTQLLQLRVACIQFHEVFEHTTLYLCV
jgi:hypothetical protein